MISLSVTLAQTSPSEVSTRGLLRAFGWTSSEAFTQQDVQVSISTQDISFKYMIFIFQGNDEGIARQVRRENEGY
jgi:hypothetical protein